MFHDGKFEYIICNYKAYICWEREIFEDKTIVTEESRIKYYGQGDHVRLYGNDIVARVEGFGFDVWLLKCSEIVDEKYICRLGFIKEGSILLCRKDIFNPQ